MPEFDRARLVGANGLMGCLPGVWVMSESLEISCAEVKLKLDTGTEFLLLDCREADEHELVHLEAALLLPMSELIDRAEELEPHRDREIVVHCHHGGRSLRVTHWLLDNGFTNVKSMAGGIDEWATTIDPELPRY